MCLKIALRVRSAMFSVIKSNQGRRQRAGGGGTKGGGGQGEAQYPTPFPGGKNFFSCIIGKLQIFTCE